MLSALRIGARGGYRIWGLKPHITPRPIHMPAFAMRGLSQVTSLQSEFDDLEPISSVQMPPNIQLVPYSEEPTLASLGLANNTPPGYVQSILEYFHVHLDVPWWGAIMIGTVCVRIIIFPLVIKARRDGAKFNNTMPGAMAIQNKFAEARQRGDLQAASKYSIELTKYMKSSGANPFKTMIAPLAQIPFFISFFLGLRSMATLPVESLKHGGTLWFQDLTLADPYFILPIMTSVTLYVTITLGAETGKIPNETIFKMLKLMPFCMLPFTMQFPTAILTYWATTNFITLGQVVVLKVPRIQRFFKIPEMIDRPILKTVYPERGFVKDAKESFINLKVAKEMEERRMLDELIQRKREEIRRRRGDK